MKYKTRASDSLGAMTAGSIGSGIFRSKVTPQDDQRWKQNYVDPKSLQRNDAGCWMLEGWRKPFKSICCAWQHKNPLMNLRDLRMTTEKSYRESTALFRLAGTFTPLLENQNLTAIRTASSIELSITTNTHVVYAALRNDMLPCQAQWMPLRTAF